MVDLSFGGIFQVRFYQFFDGLVFERNMRVTGAVIFHFLISKLKLDQSENFNWRSQLSAFPTVQESGSSG